MSIDIIELIETYDLYVLPPIVGATVLGAWLRGRRGSAEVADDDEALRLARLDRERAIRRAGLLNYGLVARAVVTLVPRLQAYFVLGEYGTIPFLDVVLPIVVAIANVPIGLGIRRLRAWARWGEAVWNGVVAAAVLALSVLLWHYGQAVYATDWPDIAIAKALPVFLLVLMFLPGTAKVVSAGHRALRARTPGVTNRRVRCSVVSALTIGFLVILGSVVIRDALDWVVRARFEIAATAPGRP